MRIYGQNYEVAGGHLTVLTFPLELSTPSKYPKPGLDPSTSQMIAETYMY